MISWIVTFVVVALVGRIVWAEVKCGRRSRDFLSKLNSDITHIHSRASITYRARYGKDPEQADKT